MREVRLGDRISPRDAGTLPEGSTFVMMDGKLLITGMGGQLVIREFSPGDDVQHKKYGSGVVVREGRSVKIEGDGDTLVGFDNGAVIRSVNAADLQPFAPAVDEDYCTETACGN